MEFDHGPVPTTGVPTTSNALTLFTTTTSTFTMVWSNHTTSPTTDIISKTTPYDRPTSTDIYPYNGPSPRRRPRITAHEIYPVRSSPSQGSQSPSRNTASPLRDPQPLSSRVKRNPFAPTQRITHRAPGPDFRFHQFTNPLGNDTLQGIHVPERINYTSTHPKHTVRPTASSCSFDNWKLSMSKRVGIEISH